MKKLLYLLPLILLGLNILPVSLYKDTVKQTGVTALSPSSWHMANESVSFSINLGSITSLSAASAAQQAKDAQYVSIGSTFRGFPYGAYFSKSTSDFSLSAYSILWAVVDGSLVIVAFLIAMILNRKPKNAHQLTDKISPETPPVNNYSVQPVAPNSIETENIVRPAALNTSTQPINNVYNIASPPEVSAELKSPDQVENNNQPQIITPTPMPTPTSQSPEQNDPTTSES